VEALLAALEHSTIAEALRFSRWGYAALNAAHILGLSLLVGASTTLNLRLLGLWPGTPRAALARVLVPVAAAGLAIAAGAGAFLFSVQATEYAAIGFLQLKLALVAAGTLSALFAHAVYGYTLERAGDRALRRHALVSLTCWTGALICGRLIAFADT